MIKALKNLPLAIAVTMAQPPAAGAEELRKVLLVGNSVSGTISILGVDESSGGKLENLGSIDAVPDLNQRLREINKFKYERNKLAEKLEHGEPADGTRLIDDMFLSHDGKTLYTSRSILGDVVAFDLSRPGFPMLWRTPIAGGKADHAAMSPNGDQIVVSASAANLAQILDVKTGGVISSFATGPVPHQNDWIGNKIYNASIGAVFGPTIAGFPILSKLPGFNGPNKLTIVDATDPRAPKTINAIPFKDGIRPAVFSADEKTLYSEFSCFNGVRKIDLDSGNVSPDNGQVQAPLSPYAKGTYKSCSDYPHRAAWHGLALSGDGTKLCAAGTIDNSVSIINTSDLKVQATIDNIGSVPYWATTSADGNLCYVSLSGDNKISVIDYKSGKEVQKIEVGGYPQRNRMATIDPRVLSLIPAQKACVALPADFAAASAGFKCSCQALKTASLVELNIIYNANSLADAKKQAGIAAPNGCTNFACSACPAVSSAAPKIGGGAGPAVLPPDSDLDPNGGNGTPAY